MSLLSISDLHVAYGKVEAVRGISLALEQGQIVTVIGPNGGSVITWRRPHLARNHSVTVQESI